MKSVENSLYVCLNRHASLCLSHVHIQIHMIRGESGQETTSGSKSLRVYALAQTGTLHLAEALGRGGSVPIWCR